MFYPLLTAVVMLGVGIGALRLNPHRPINRALATICFLSVLIFSVQLVAKHKGALYLIDRTSNPLPWIRLKFALIGLLSPLMVWVCYYLVSGRYTSRRDLLMKLTPWIALSAFLFYFPFTELQTRRQPAGKHSARPALLSLLLADARWPTGRLRFRDHCRAAIVGRPET